MAKFSLYLFLAACLAVCSAQFPSRTTSNAPAVSIEKVNDMTPTMQLDASEFLKRAYSMSNNADKCSIFRQLFSEKYTQYKWHVTMYKAYSVQSIKSIVLKVGSDRFLLFATKK